MPKGTTVKVTISVSAGTNYTAASAVYTLSIGTKVITGTGITVSEIADQTYTGNEIKPEPVIKDGTVTLVKGIDYTLTYPTDVTNAGEKTVTITGIGNYTGNISKQFVINPLEISNTQIAPIENQTYTGQEIKPNILITNGSSKLISFFCYLH